MGIKIINPKEDMYGNIKENIFLAFNDNGEFCGNAYVYPTINHHQASDTPYLLFIDVNSSNKDVKQILFNRVFERAKELRASRPELKARIYSGFEPDQVKLDFYNENGFQSHYSVFMDVLIPSEFSYNLPEYIRAQELNFDTEDKLMKYKKIHDEIFITPLNIETYREQEKKNIFKNILFYKDDQLIGGCTVFKDQEFGYIETLYVTERFRGKGYGKNIMMYIFNYFTSNGLMKSKLEVWEQNKAAVELYKSLGFKVVKNNLMFPGITI